MCCNFSIGILCWVIHIPHVQDVNCSVGEKFERKFITIFLFKMLTESIGLSIGCLEKRHSENSFDKMILNCNGLPRKIAKK